MGWLSRFVQCLIRGIRPDDRLDTAPCWKLPNVPRDLPAFVRALPKLLPEGGVFYMEGPTDQTPPEVRSFLEANSVDDEVKLPRGILWPRPDIFHVPIRDEVMGQLADLLADYETPVGMLHLQTYRGKQVLLWGFDAFYDDPFIISKKVPEENVAAFCKALGCSYEEG